MSYDGKVRLPGQHGKDSARFLRGATFDEIARELRVSKASVWFLYCSAMRKLRRSGRAKQLLQLAQAKDERSL